MKPHFRIWRGAVPLVLITTLLLPGVNPAQRAGRLLAPVGIAIPVDKTTPPPSGIYDFREVDFGTGITECPQAGNPDAQPKPLDHRAKDEVERMSDRGDDRRLNQDYSCFPQDETSIAVSPANDRNVVAGANDYRLGTGSSGFYASSDGGKRWYDGIIPFPSVPAGLSRGEGYLPSGGDPVIAFDREGVAYYAQIAFFRGDDTNGVFVQRSSNGGFTWSRACVPAGTTDANAACGAVGDVRQPGDGRVSFNPDNDLLLNGSVPFDDKEWMTTGPRPAGVSPTCFTPITRSPTTCIDGVVGVDRIYVTFTRFTATDAQIWMSYSDDRARSWSPAKPISGSAPFCTFGVGTRCDFNQASVPTVNPATGHLYVAFENFNTPDENQYLVVRSRDGGATFEGPYFVSPVYDVNFPRAGASRPDCTARGQQNGRIVYTNTCFRSNAYGAITADPRGGAYADDLYLVFSDNRNGTIGSSNADIFLFKSTNGGETWIGPTRVNNDRSSLGTISRECGRATPNAIPAECRADFGNDQWWPWIDIGTQGQLNITFHDRRLDTASTAIEWPASRQRPGNYLVWTWGAQCRVSQPDSRECLAPSATTIAQPAAPVDSGNDPVPGQGDGYLGTLRNFQISDVPSNFDYSFRAGIFAGDYENVAVSGEKAYASWTDARNGRSSRTQVGRNPICEQSDAFVAVYNSMNGGSGGRAGTIDPFLVTPCPAQAIDPGRRR